MKYADKQNKMLVEELLIRTLEGQDKEVQSVLLETFTSEYGAISDVNGERVRQVLELDSGVGLQRSVLFICPIKWE